MIFADKLVQLRKKAGWSQEELAEQMNVTRQSVSKWEGAQSVPDLEKIILLSELFGVSTDYLLKDRIEDAECNIPSDDLSALRHVSMEEANAFLSVKAKTSKAIALATFLCFLSPVCLLMILVSIEEISAYSLAYNVAVVIGITVLLLLVTAAAALFISSGRKTAEYGFLKKEIFETEYGVSEMVSELKAKYSKTYTRNNIIGVGFCIMSMISLLVGAIFNYVTVMLSAFFVLVGIGVVLFVRSGIIWASYEKLLQEGDYSKEKKWNRYVISAVSVAYWLIAAAVYLGYSLYTNNWEYSWVIFVIAGVAFPAIVIITDLLGKRR